MGKCRGHGRWLPTKRRVSVLHLGGTRSFGPNEFFWGVISLKRIGTCVRDNVVLLVFSKWGQISVCVAVINTLGNEVENLTKPEKKKNSPINDPEELWTFPLPVGVYGGVRFLLLTCSTWLEGWPSLSSGISPGCPPEQAAAPRKDWQAGDLKKTQRHRDDQL